MHRFFLTSNLGGGGTNVSRLYDYIEMFSLPHIGMLLNYYYLTGHAVPLFDKKLTEDVRGFDDINNFVLHCRRHFATRSKTGWFSPSDTPCGINGFLLDNGCGNFLRDLLKQDAPHERISVMISSFLQFAEQLHFDMSIALDLAMKYTYKNGEVHGRDFDLWKNLSSDLSVNLHLLDDTLYELESRPYSHSVLAPLHGYDYNSYSEYYDSVIELENNHSARFGGFALGGIADTRKLDSELWNVPQGFTRYRKSAFLCYNLIRTIRQKTSRHIHVLGAGNIFTLPFLIHAGADSSDCHSAWRRASDGDMSKIKMLIPLMDRDFRFINDHNCLEYVKLRDMDNHEYRLNCGYSIADIKTMIDSRNSNPEDYYFGQILIFAEAMIQYSILIDFINAHSADYLDLLSATPDNALNQAYADIRYALGI